MVTASMILLAQFRQGRNDLSQNEQSLVDIDSLLHAGTLGTCAFEALTPGCKQNEKNIKQEIDQII